MKCVNNKTYLNEDIFIPLLENMSISSKQEKIEIFFMLEVEDALRLLEKNKELLRVKPSHGLNEIAIVGYEVLLKRINNMMNNKYMLCTRQKQEEIYALYYRLLDSRANTDKKSGISMSNKKKRNRKSIDIL